MTQFTPGMILEVVLAGLMVLTVGYCLVLNRRLSRLRSSQHELREIVSDLSHATFAAENAIKGLRTTTDDAEARLSEKLHKAQLLLRELAAFERKDRFGQRGPHGPAEQRTAAAEQASEPPQIRRVPADERLEIRSVQSAPTSSREVWRQHAQSRLKRAS